ncbi:MAG: hypothetical protein ACKVX7_03025 [Planctomycetota bacterium]
MRVALFSLLLLIGAVGATVQDAPTPPTEPPAEQPAGGGTGPSAKEIRALLKQSVQAGDATGLRELLERIAKFNSPDPVRGVLELANQLPPEEETWYWALIEGAAAFNRPLAYSEMGEFLVQYRTRPIARDLLHALQSKRTKYVNRVIRRVLEGCPVDMQLMAIDMAAQIPVRRTVDVLLAAYALEAKKEFSELRPRLIHALEALTHQALGDNYENWNNWWEVNRSRGLRVLREEAENQEGRTGVARDLDPVRQAEFIGLESLPPGKVLVVKGPIARNGVDTNNDHIEEVLARLGIPHTEALKERLEEPTFSLDGFAAVIINCTQIHEFCQSPGHSAGAFVGNRLHRCMGPNPHDTVQFKMKQPALEKIRAWVEKGGLLFSEDWVMVEVLAPLWPKYVAAGDKLTESHVAIRPSKGQTTNTLLRGVFVPPIDLSDVDWEAVEADEEDVAKKKYDPAEEDDMGDVATKSGGKTAVDPEQPLPSDEQFDDPDIKAIKHEWKIDNESHAIGMRAKKDVVMLITSDDLKSQTTDTAVAITFAPGRGRVLHVLSHFGKQNSSHNEATIENLLINFLLQVRVSARK